MNFGEICMRKVKGTPNSLIHDKILNFRNEKFKRTSIIIITKENSTRIFCMEIPSNIKYLYTKRAGRMRELQHNWQPQLECDVNNKIW